MNTTSPPSRSAIPERVWWMIYLGGGLYGFWRIATGDGGRINSGALFFAVFIATMPTTIIHELGHMVAGWMVGLKTLQVNFGVGPVVLKKEIGGMLLTIRKLPVSGYVIPEVAKERPRLKRIFITAGGPGANLLFAAVCLWLDNSRLAEFFTRPSFGAVFATASLLQAVMSLWPIKSQGNADIVSGSGGWQLQRLLRGKPTHYEVDELEKLGKPRTGLRELQSLTEGSRIRGVIAIILMGASVMAGTIWLANFCSLPSVQLGLTLVVECTAFVAWAIFVSRRPWTAFVTAQEKARCNPHEQENLTYRHALEAMISKWSVGGAPAEQLQEVMKSHGKPEFLSELEKRLISWPDSKLLSLLRFDELLSAKRYADAKSVIGAARQWEDLPASMARHFESLYLATSFALSPDADALIQCNHALSGIDDDGHHMKRLHAFAWVLTTQDHQEVLKKAEEWCRLAQEVYPYDPETHLQLGIILLKQKRVTEARPWLQAARAGSRKSNDSIVVDAWLAVAAAYENQTNAATLLRRSLKQDLSVPLREILETELSRISSDESSGSFPA